MKVSYRGVKAILPKLQAKVDGKFAKLSKILERRGEKEAHVVITADRHLHHAEITLQFYDHQLVCVGSDTDVATAIIQALDKLEAQAVKQRDKWREKTRRSDKPKPAVKEAKTRAAKPVEPVAEIKQQVIRVNHTNERKPMTIDEAMLEMESDRDYLVYRDAQKNTVSVLVRRRDGHFDLIES